MAEAKEHKTGEILDTGTLALRCAEFFMSLGQSCMQFYEKYNRQKDRKRKMIKKSIKQKVKISRRVDGETQQLNEDIKKRLPKKPLTAYIIYFQQKKPNFVQKYPGLNLSDLTKLIAKQWKEIDNNQRKPYLAQAQQDRKRYQTQMKDFKAKYGASNLNNVQAQDQNALKVNTQLVGAIQLKNQQDIQEQKNDDQNDQQNENELQQSQIQVENKDSENDNDNEQQEQQQQIDQQIESQSQNKQQIND